MLPKTIAVIVILSFLAGCVGVKRQPAPTLADDVFDATSVYLAARPQRAANVLDAATKIKAAAQSGVDVTVLRSLVVNLMLERAGIDDDDRATAAFLANLIVSRIQRRMGVQIDVDVVPAGKLDGVRSAIIEACDAAIRAAEPFAR